MDFHIFFKLVPATRNLRSPFVRFYSMGCPTPETHPHLLSEGELTPGLLEQEYELRRAKLISQLPDRSISIISGFGLRYATNNIFHRFHQNTDLNYFTGFNEPNAIAVLEKDSSLDRKYKFKLFLQPKIKSLEIWDGPRSGVEGAVSFFKADEAFSISEFPSFLSDTLIASTDTSIVSKAFPSITKSNSNLFSNVSNVKEFDGTHINFNTRSLTTNPNASLFSSQYVSNKKNTHFNIQPLKKYTDSIRNIKSSAEIAIMKASGNLSGKAFVDVLHTLKPGMSEHEVSATLEYGIKRRGGTRFAYEPVVAGGKNALILHYVLNQQLLKAGDLVLIDAGGEFGNYSSDITRTYPVSGRYTDAQKEIYEAVLSANLECISQCKATCHVSLDNLHRVASMMLQKKLETLFQRSIPQREWEVIYPHFIGHYIGMDVHDTASLPRSAVLVGGNVITIEPGIYIPDTEDFPEEYRGIGIRIEDDVVISHNDDEPFVLSSEAPKDIAIIERLMSTQGK